MEFRTLGFLSGLFSDAGLGVHAAGRFQVPYLAHELVARYFPAGDDRVGLLKLIEGSVTGDLLGMNARTTERGVHIAFQAVVLSAIRREA